MRKSGPTFCHGTVVAPKQCLYQKEATRMESPKMYCARWCKNLTYLCGTANDPISSRPVEGRERKFAEFRVYFYAMVPYLHQSNIYIKRKLSVWRVQNCKPLVGSKTSLTCAGLQITPSQGSEYSAENGNFRKSGSTLSNGTVFAPKQCLYQTEATGMESPKM